MIDAAFVLRPGTVGMIDASATSRPSTPRTRSRAFTTAFSPVPMAHVPTGCCVNPRSHECRLPVPPRYLRSDRANLPSSDSRLWLGAINGARYGDSPDPVDGRTAAEKPSARQPELPPVHLRLGLAHVVPDELWLEHRLEEGERHPQEKMIVRTACFEQQHGSVRSGAESVGDHAAGRARADDDVVDSLVVLLSHSSLVRREQSRSQVLGVNRGDRRPPEQWVAGCAHATRMAVSASRSSRGLAKKRCRVL
jgi:hypothetical protein